MCPETASKPTQTPETSTKSADESSQTFGIANSFTDSQQRRNRKTPAAQNSPSDSANSAPSPLPKRPKGRFFVGSMLLTLIAGFVYSIRSAFFSVAAHGVIEGRKLEICSLESSIIRTIHVHDGEFVRQGDPLVTLKSKSHDCEFKLLCKTVKRLVLWLSTNNFGANT